MTYKFILIFIVTVFLFTGSLACANDNVARKSCPNINNQVDWNCDGKLKIIVLGDSIVAGVGGNSGGYVARLRGKLPNADIKGLAVPGITSSGLLSRVKRGGFSNSDILQADYIFIAVGVNDYWTNLQPSNTVANIRRIGDYLKSYYRFAGLKTPVVKVMTLTPTKRSYQAPFIASVNSMLRRYVQVGPDFYRLDKNHLSADGLHPNSTGYQVLADMLYNYINNNLKREISGK